MSGRIVSWAGSTLITAGGGALWAQAGDDITNAAKDYGPWGLILAGLASFFAPYVRDAIKEWREERKLSRAERRQNFQGQLSDMQDELAEVQAKLGLASHLLGVAMKAVHVNRNVILESYRTGQPIGQLPEGFMQREFDTASGTIEALMAQQPSRTVMDVLERRRAMPTPDPAALRRRRPQQAGDTNRDMPAIPDATADAPEGEATP